MKAKIFSLTLVLAIGLLAGGCTPTISNLSPERIPQNPSGIYTLSMSPQIRKSAIDDNTETATIVIDGARHEMMPSKVSENVYDFEYTIPKDRNNAVYYYEFEYESTYDGSTRKRLLQSPKQKLILTNRYVITLESVRGPVGAEIPVVGRGFSKFDKIVIGGIEADTRYASPNAVSFIVPPLPAGQSYDVEIISGNGQLPISSFLVDGAILRVDPQAIDILTGQKTLMVFGIEFPAPAGGIGINVSTDIPESVIMDQVIIPAGARSVNIAIEAGVPGTGKLVVEAPGFNKITVPVVVK